MIDLSQNLLDTWKARGVEEKAKEKLFALTPELERIVDQKVKSGLYNSASEVVREGLRLLQQRDEMREAKLEALRAEIQKGINSLEAGEIYDGPATMAEFREKLLRMKQENAQL